PPATRQSHRQDRRRRKQEWQDPGTSRRFARGDQALSGSRVPLLHGRHGHGVNGGRRYAVSKAIRQKAPVSLGRRNLNRSCKPQTTTQTEDSSSATSPCWLPASYAVPG